ncbi:signal peptide peptidase SppA [Chitinophagales bacterium]|nr:signal peptide peptidase SppA [Chitinophagales bacterium]
MSFIKYTLAALFAIFLFFGILLFIGLGSIWMASGDAPQVKANSILYATFDKPIGETGVESPFEGLDVPIGPDSRAGLDDIRRALNNARNDDNIKGVLLNLSGIPAGMAKIDAIRDELLAFRDTDKFVMAYGEGFSQKAYYLATAADEVYLNPSGAMELKGFSAQLSFFKNMLDRLEIEPQIFYAGKFKSATEPFRMAEMSPENRDQITALLNQYYELFVGDIADARNLPVAQVRTIIDSLKVQFPSDAVELGVIDGEAYYDEVLAKLRDKIGIDSDESIPFVKMSKYIQALPAESGGYSKDKIAVVYAEGGIVDGPGTEEEIGSGRFAKILRKIREDDKVKAVVMRVNSGGGSALASDIIWREIEMLKEKGIPVVTSMGDVAASGGYFIAANSDKIFAEEYTITGSIGVFGVLANFEKFYNKKLGITFDEVNTGPYADFPNSFMLTDEITEGQKVVIQKFIDKIYLQFKGRVADGRGLTIEQVEEIAQGRVWTAEAAKDVGLVDEIAGIDAAIDAAASLAGLEMGDYRTAKYPKSEDPLEKLLKGFSGEAEDEVMMRYLQSELGGHYKYIKQLHDLTKMNRAQMRMPFEIDIY